MAHFAKLDENNIVTQVIVVHNNELLDENGQENEAMGIEFCKKLLGGTWIQTSYNGTIRKNYAVVGCPYDATRDAFLTPQPFQSWVFDETSCQWNPPTPRPQDGKSYSWDEDSISWIEVIE